MPLRSVSAVSGFESALTIEFQPITTSTHSHISLRDIIQSSQLARDSPWEVAFRQGHKQKQRQHERHAILKYSTSFG